MERTFERWTAGEYSGYKLDVENILLDKGLSIILRPENSTMKGLQLHWEHFVCYQVTDESYREDCWISDPKDYWAFYVSDDSEKLKVYRGKSTLLPKHTRHFLLVGTNTVVDVLAPNNPEIILVDEIGGIGR